MEKDATFFLSLWLIIYILGKYHIKALPLFIHLLNLLVALLLEGFTVVNSIVEGH